MAPDSETTSEKVEKNLSDLTLPDICSLSQDLNFHISESSNLDKGENVNGVLQSPNGKVEDADDGIPIPEVQLYPPGQVCLEWTKVHKVGAGLANLGNTCFLNTVIQCLTYCPPLANYLLQGDHSANCKSYEFCMMCELQKHMRQVFQRSGDVIKPLCIYQNLKYIADHFQFGQQEDAHEFLRFVIDNLWRSSIYSHLNDKLDPASRETTIINHIFGGYNRSQVVCLQCNLKSDKYEHFMDFILDIQNAHSLEKAVEQFVKPELLEKENAYKCPKCDALVPAEKTFTIHRPPNVATFQLKRFHYYKSYGKITKHVSYPENFDLRPYMSQRKGASLVYKLNAVLVHVGQNCNSGHYYCYIRNSNGSWYLMDDAKVQKVSLHDVLNQQAYVLFYVRSSPNGISFKNNYVSSIMDFQNIKIRSTDVMPQLSSLKKRHSFQKTSECVDKSFEKGSSSAVCSPPLSSQKTFNGGNTQSCTELNSFFDQPYGNESLDPKYSRAFKFSNRKSPYTYDKHSTYRKVSGRAQHRNFNLQYENGSSDEGCLVPWSHDSSYSHLSSFEKNSHDREYGKSSSVVRAYNAHSCGSYDSVLEEHKYTNSAAKYNSYGKSSLHRFEGNNFCISSNMNITRNQYFGGKNSFYMTGNIIDNHQRYYYGISDRFERIQRDQKLLQNKFYRHREYNVCKNKYISSGGQEYHIEYKYNAHINDHPPLCASSKGYQSNEQFSYASNGNELIPRNGDYRTFCNYGEQHQVNEIRQNSPQHFSESQTSERNTDFRNNFSKNRYDNDWVWRKEYSKFPSILQDYGCRIYQGKVKCSRPYFSCRMAHFSSPTFPKFKGFHPPSPYHDKCFYLNIC